MCVGSKGVVCGVTSVLFLIRLKCSILSLPASLIFSFCHPYISFHLFPWQLCLISSTPPLEHPSCHPISFLLTAPRQTCTRSHQRLSTPPRLPSCVSHLSTHQHFFLKRQPHPPSLLVLQFSHPAFLFHPTSFFFPPLQTILPPQNTPPLPTHYLLTGPLLAAASPFELFMWCHRSYLISMLTLMQVCMCVCECVCVLACMHLGWSYNGIIWYMKERNTGSMYHMTLHFIIAVLSMMDYTPVFSNYDKCVWSCLFVPMFYWLVWEAP